ncbi:MAG TPA: alpha/beta hydrolase [Micromonosporaceae bacterium]|nr:alpha/beta hydrolase [Micromonosporaceae bacterium]
MSTTGTDRAAVVVPGRMHGPTAPLLMYSADAAHARGARIERLSWTDLAQLQDVALLDAGPWVRNQVGSLLDHLPADRPLLIVKSLGTHAAALAAERQLPAIWLTPLLHLDEIVSALQKATAPCLLVGGTADPMWDGVLARELSPYVLEVDGADHGMYVPGPLAASAQVLGRVATAVENFLDSVVWPDAAAGH